jgi:glycosyltransferase involved in cell wall biosynthesis
MLPALDQRDNGPLVYVYGRPETIERIRFSARRVVFREVRVRAGIGGRLWAEQIRLPRLFRKDRIDLVYTANNTDLFLAPRPRVTAIRYTEPFVFRDYYNSFWKRIRCGALRFLTRISLGTVDHVVCVSRYALRLAFKGREAELAKATVIHHGLGEPFTPAAARPAWATGDFLFAAAKMIGYSNLHTLADAYAQCVIGGLDLPLFIAGGPHDDNYERSLKKRIASLGIKDKVVFLGYVDQASMAGGLAHARAFIFSSLLEACPNTLLEALGCGAAIVASDTEPNREVAGDAVAWCDGTNARSMAMAIVRVCRDDVHRSILRRKALSQASEYSWEATADRLIRLLERVLEAHRSRGVVASSEELVRRVRQPTR